MDDYEDRFYTNGRVLVEAGVPGLEAFNEAINSMAASSRPRKILALHRYCDYIKQVLGSLSLEESVKNEALHLCYCYRLAKQRIARNEWLYLAGAALYWALAMRNEPLSFHLIRNLLVGSANGTKANAMLHRLVKYLTRFQEVLELPEIPFDMEIALTGQRVDSAPAARDTVTFDLRLVDIMSPIEHVEEKKKIVVPVFEESEIIELNELRDLVLHQHRRRFYCLLAEAPQLMAGCLEVRASRRNRKSWYGVAGAIFIFLAGLYGLPEKEIKLITSAFARTYGTSVRTLNRRIEVVAVVVAAAAKASSGDVIGLKSFIEQTVTKPGTVAKPNDVLGAEALLRLRENHNEETSKLPIKEGPAEDLTTIDDLLDDFFGDRPGGW